MAGADKDLVLGYDLGTSALKAVIVDREGRVRASASASYPLLLPAPGYAEQRPSDWWSAMTEVTPHLLAETQADSSRIAALAVAAQMCGVVPVGRNGDALCNALTWLDTRSSGIAQRLVRGKINIGGYGVRNLWRWLPVTGGAPNPSGRDPPSKILWLSENEPGLWRNTHKLLDTTDYLVHRLTGNFVTSHDRAHVTWLFDARPARRNWSDSLLRHVGIESALLPEVKGAAEIAGALRGDVAESLGLQPGIPVATGLGDLCAAAIASGATAMSAPHLNVGTSTWLGAHLARSRVNPLTNIGSICSANGNAYLLIATQENAGACVNWALGALGFAQGDFAGFETEARAAQPRDDAPMFFPWLSGERVPADNKNVRGGFAGLALATSRGELARAVYEGVALNLRWAMGDFDRLGECRGRPLRLVGGAAESALWCQIFADVLGRPLERVETPALAGARGAAMVAAVAAGWRADVAAAASTTRVERTFAPDPKLAAHYATRFDRFTRGYQRLRPWYDRFGRSGHA